MNGARFYVDHAHPEYSCPEVTNARDLVIHEKAGERIIEIARREDGWEVRGQAIERAAAMTYWEYDQSVRRFQRILRALGIEDGLREAGVSAGDTVFIGEFELEWQD